MEKIFFTILHKKEKFLMSNHNICFHGEIKKNVSTFWLIKNTLSGTMNSSVVQSIVSLMSSLVVKNLTALVSTISNSQLFLLKKCE